MKTLDSDEGEIYTYIHNLETEIEEMNVYMDVVKDKSRKSKKIKMLEF